jgi:hypothetical protein
MKKIGIRLTGILLSSVVALSYIGTAEISPVYAAESAAPSNDTDILTLTKGTFSFFNNSDLSGFDKDDIDEMDENTYIKYLDSFLMGYAMLDYCILQDSGKLLKDVYDSESKIDPNVAAMTMQSYLINYRNNYLSDSLAGPFRNEKSMKRALNRAIRYDIDTFGAVYKSSSVGDDETKIKKLLENLVNEIKAEQGVSFTCRMEYGDYTIRDGSTGKGWIIEFTKKN